MLLHIFKMIYSIFKRLMLYYQGEEDNRNAWGEWKYHDDDDDDG